MRFVPTVACVALWCCVTLYSAIAAGHTKTDVITVENGDTITGAIDSMTAGKLALNTDYAGVIKIKWREVEQIDSRYVYEVRLDDGERLYGRFAKTEEKSVLTFKVRGGQRQLDLEDIVEIRSIEEQLADQLDLKVTSTIYADPNATTVSLSTSGTYDTRGGRTGFSGRIDDNKTKAVNEAGDTVENTLNSSNFTLYREFWRSRGTAQSYRVLNAVYSSNDALGVDHRFSMGVGLGRYFIQELGHELAVSTGIQGVQERTFSCDEPGLGDGINGEPIDCVNLKNGDGDLIDNAAEMFFNMQWHLYSFASRDMDISMVGNAYPSLSEWGDIRGDFNLMLSWELFPSFYWSINARTEFDSSADQRGQLKIDTTDYTITTGITWSY
ncbi:DUF481 domain-containing protein [Luminiphilus sp.]|nr:DUF481 domain-containing protein [Luminiphilus sp.]